LMKRLLVVVGVVASSGLLLGCGGDKVSSSEGSGGTTIVESVVDAGAIIIDVRSPEEFMAGHLDGALNYNVEDGTLAEQLVGLDPSANYIVYCRSGRRSAIAADMMRNAGFESVTDLGSLEDASSSTGVSIVVG